MRQTGREEVPMPDMIRRDFVTVLASVLAGAIGSSPMGVQAQQRFRVGLLDTGLGARFAVPFTRKLVELGYVEGRNLVLERRSAEGNVERLTIWRQSWYAIKSMSS
jgi:putative ABC transport system substrate-binding protein